MKSIKVLIIAPIVFPLSPTLKYAGTERVIAGLVEEFSSDKSFGIDSIVASTGDSDIKNVNLIYVYSQALWPLDDFERKIIDPIEALEQHISFCLDYAIKNNIDLIHDNTGMIESIAYNKIKDELKIPIITTIHTDINNKNMQRFASYKRAQEENRNVYFICISKSQKDKFEKKLGIKVLDFVHNGIYTKKYPYVEKGEKQDYLFWLGRICSDKGTDLAIKLAKASKRPLILAGEVHTPDKEFFEKEIKPHINRWISGKNLEEKENNKSDMIKKLQNNEKIINSDDIFFIGPINDYEKGVLNSYAYSLIMLNRWDEPFGLVMPEAMITGTPVIGTEKGSIPEVILNNKTGFVLPFEYKEESEQLIKEEMLIEDAKNALEKIPRLNPIDCKKHTENNFSLNVMAKKYAEIYKKILKDNGKVKNKSRKY